jgi:SP family arabinose:H+ symporter-like MFS transporter
MWLAGGFGQYVVWRLIGGLGIGGASIIAPMYIAEISPARMRGRLVTLYQLGIVLGILAAVFVNMLIQRHGTEAWNTETGWRWMFLAGIFPAMLFAALILPAVESPRWLIKRGQTEEAVKVLRLINGAAIATEEASSIQAALELEEGRIRELFTAFRKPLLIGIMLAGLQQVSGITPLLAFLPEIFRTAGTGTSDAFFQSVLVGLVNIVFTLVALWLIDRAGRKSLILAGSAVQCASFVVVGWTYHVHAHGIALVAAVMAFVAGHAVGNGAACWVIISEIYPTKVRGRAMSIATTMLWFVGYLGSQMFPIMQKYWGPAGTFWAFSSGALLTLVCVAAFVPETKGRTLEEITQYWARGQAHDSISSSHSAS